MEAGKGDEEREEKAKWELDPHQVWNQIDPHAYDHHRLGCLVNELISSSFSQRARSPSG